MYEQVYHGFLLVCMIVLGALIMLCLLRAILGPRLADRVVAVNMIGTMTITEIAMFALYLRENYLYDVCLIYAMISFLGVVLFCKVYTGVYLQRKHMLADLKAIEDNLDKQAADHEGLQEEEVAR